MRRPLPAGGWIAQRANHRVGELGSRLADQDLLVAAGADRFGHGRRGHDRHPRRHRFEHFVLDPGREP